jgi:hypothetical protein
MGQKAASKHIFVTYARANSSVVLPTIEKIEASGYKLWYDKGISPSSTWTDEIANAIIDCEAVIAFISKESMASPYVRNEIEFAISKHKKILPVYLDGMDILPPGLALVLNTTQGVVGKKNPDEIAEQICAGLVFFGTMIKGLGRSVSGEKPRRTLPAAAVAAAVLLLIIAAGVWNFIGGRKSTDYAVNLNKRVYLPAEPITIKVSDVTQEMIDSAALIGIWEKGGDASKYLAYTYVKDGDLKLRAPATPGVYELRAYSSDKLLPANQRGAKNFEVSKSSLGTFKLAVDKNEYLSQEQIIVNIKDVPQLMINDGAIVGIYKSGAPSENYLTYGFIYSRDQEFRFDAPNEAGGYEIRAYTNRDVWRGETMVAQAVVNVNPRPQPPEVESGIGEENDILPQQSYFDGAQHSK